MSSNTDEPVFVGPRREHQRIAERLAEFGTVSCKETRSVDEHLIDTFGPYLPVDAPTCYGGFDALWLRDRGCHQCTFFDKCRDWTAVRKPPKPNCYGNFGWSMECDQCFSRDECRDDKASRDVPVDRHEGDPNGIPQQADRAESDPNGLDQHAPGAKLDHGKTRLWLVFSGFASALEEVGKVGTYGAKKYSDNGWRSVPDGEARYTDALLRHLLAEARGEIVDEESGLYHAAHAAWNSLARLELMLRTAPHGTMPDSDSSVR